MAKHALLQVCEVNKWGVEMWYVVQVRTGTEEAIKVQCEKVVEKRVLGKCFIPYYKALKKYHGDWHVEQKILFPGYIFIISDDAERLFLELKKVLGLTKLLGMGQDILPLSETEIEFLRLCGKEEMIVDISVGIIEDGGLRVIEGPLMGLERYVRKIDRHKRRAYIEVELAGEVKRTQVGLEVVEKDNYTPKMIEEGARGNVQRKYTKVR